MTIGSPIGLLLSLTYGNPVATFTTWGITVGTTAATKNLSDSDNTFILKGEVDTKSINDTPNEYNINTTDPTR